MQRRKLQPPSDCVRVGSVRRVLNSFLIPHLGPHNDTLQIRDCKNPKQASAFELYSRGASFWDHLVVTCTDLRPYSADAKTKAKSLCPLPERSQSSANAAQERFLTE